MLNKVAFANALALLTAALYLVFYVLSALAPAAFVYLFNAQFLGADIAVLIPEMTAGAFAQSAIVLIIMAWLMGYVWAWLYNYFAKK